MQYQLYVQRGRVRGYLYNGITGEFDSMFEQQQSANCARELHGRQRMSFNA